MRRQIDKPLALVAALAFVFGAGCVTRTISVHSDPPGARVYLDGEDIGQTPVVGHRFEFYGVREFVLVKPGHEVQRRTVNIRTPWYSMFPIDIVTELLLPIPIRDDRFYHFDLPQTERAEVTAVMRDAHHTRQEARTRIEAARERARYRPPAYVVKGAEKPFILWAPWIGPPRLDPEDQEEVPIEP